MSELKTESNKLSVWQVETDDDLENAFVALGSNCQNVGAIWAVKLSPDDLVDIGFDDEEGETPATAINGMHRNICELTYASLGDVIGSILHALRDEGLVHKTRGQMKTLLAKAYANRMLDAEGLNDSVLRDIKKELQKHPEMISSD